MTEPTYEYVKGTGWVAYPASGGLILTPEECMGKWVKHPKNPNFNDTYAYVYPAVCANWAIMPDRFLDLLPGDVVPWPGGSYIYVITKIIDKSETHVQYEYHSITPDGEKGTTEVAYLKYGFCGVARRVA